MEGLARATDPAIGPAPLAPGRATVRPATGAGVVTAVLLGALPAAFVGLESAWLVVVAGLSCLLLAPLVARRQVSAPGLVQCPARLRVHAGRTTPVSVTLGCRGESRGLLLDLGVVGAPRTGDGAPRLAVPLLSARDGHRRVTVPVRLGARGIYSSASLRFVSSFPFSMARATRVYEMPTRVIVLPRLLAPAERSLIERLARPASIGTATDEVARLRTPGLPLGLRDARQGDRARDIDARATLRKGRWIAIERSSLRDDREIAIGLVLRVRGASASSRRRNHLAFEAAVAHCACAIDLFVRRFGDVTLEELQPDQARLDGDPHAALDPVALARPRASASSPEPLLDRLAAVRLAETPEAAGAAHVARPARRDRAVRRVVFLPLSPLEFQRATEDQDAAVAPQRPGGRSDAWLIGVDGSGRSILLGTPRGQGGLA